LHHVGPESDFGRLKAPWCGKTALRASRRGAFRATSLFWRTYRIARAPARAPISLLSGFNIDKCVAQSHAPAGTTPQSHDAIPVAAIGQRVLEAQYVGVGRTLYYEIGSTGSQNQPARTPAAFATRQSKYRRPRRRAQSRHAIVPETIGNNTPRCRCIRTLRVAGARPKVLECDDDHADASLRARLRLIARQTHWNDWHCVNEDDA
jgi:hypothetical protein